MKIPPTLTSGREPNNNNNKPYVSIEKYKSFCRSSRTNKKLNPKTIKTKLIV
nr:MAG TPA: hypothetical protein [Caudoviricetes sp.]